MTERQGTPIRAAHPPRDTRRATQSIVPTPIITPLGHPLRSQTLASQSATAHNPDTLRSSRICAQCNLVMSWAA